MLNFPVDIATLSPLENSSSAVIVAVDDVLVAYRNMMEDWVDPTYRHLAKDSAFAAANRLRNIGVYQSRSRLMLHAALFWVGLRAPSTAGWSRMLESRKVYVLMEDDYISSVGYKIIFMVEADRMSAHILDIEGEPLAQVAATM